MDTEQARRLITLHDNADRAVLNLRNAGAMSTDDPRATELLEGAGDRYASAVQRLARFQGDIIAADARSEMAPVAEVPGPQQAPSGVAEGAEVPRPVQDPPDGAGEPETPAEPVGDGPPLA